MATLARTSALNEQSNSMIRDETYSRPAEQGTEDISAKPALSSIISVHDFEDVARQSFSEKAYAFYSSAATDLVSHNANLMCQRKLLLRPKVLRNVKNVTTKRSILGSDSSAPFFFSPAAMATLAHEKGELAVARACANEGIVQMVSSNASYPLADIVSAGKPGQPFFLQLYVNSDRSKTEELLLSAKKLGIKAILLTVDAPVPGKREADERIAAGNVSAAISGAVATNDKRGGGLGRGMGKYIDSALCWEDLAWIKRVSGLPLVLKGIQTASDARKAVKFGAEGILLSNHGGRSLDTTQPAMMTLLELHKCAPEVFAHLEVYVDGGFTRGTDILKAIALGATAVGIGRPWLYALTYGQEGVEHLCDILKDELITSMKLSGITDVDEAHPGMIKCELRNDEPPCARCQRKGLECILHIPNRTATEDHKQISLLGKDMLSVHDTLQRICQHLEIRHPDPMVSYPNITGNETQAAQNGYEQDDDGVCELSPPASPSAAKAPIDSYLTSLQETSPAGTSPQKVRRNTLAPADMITKGVIKAVFSSDEMTPVPKMLAVQLNHFSRELDQWYNRFSPLFEADPHIGGFPLAGLKLHHQFGRLYLGHHVLRGLQKTDPIPLHFQQAALTAREAAGTIFSMILDNDALRANIVGMPHYFHIMISFAGHFSLDVCMKFSEQLGVNVHDEFTRISSVLAFFAHTDVVAQHPLARVTTGLMRKLSDCSAALGMEGVLTGSPFSRLEGQYAAARDFGLASTSEAQQPGLLPGTTTPFDWQALPTDFLYTDFADFDFADTQFDFVT
ncbi:cytochrome b2 [Hortaea werneckii]|nr:cytochrome b2 [Hortaea werneckii]